MKNVVHETFAILYPERARETLTEWEKGALILANPDIKKVGKEKMLLALITLLLTTPPSSPEAYDAKQPIISKLVENILGTRVHENILEDIRGLLEERWKVEKIRERIAVAAQ